MEREKPEAKAKQQSTEKEESTPRTGKEVERRRKTKHDDGEE
jgi:hypothetical protein